MRFRDDCAKSAGEAMNAVWVLIIINVAVYILNIGENGKLYLWSDERLFAPYQLITYMFFHADFTHILFNMYGLYLFGSLVAPILGRKRFLILYFLSGICGAVFHLLANWNSQPVVPTVGASGALFGVMMAVAMIRPNVEMYLMFIPVPIKMKTMVVVYALLEIFSQWKLNTNIAHLAHLGGFAGAYIYLIFFCRREVVWSLKDIFRRRSFGGGNSAVPPTDNAGGSAAAPEDDIKITRVSQQEVDRLLDKISREGINSLSDYERAELQFFREQMKNSTR